MKIYTVTVHHAHNYGAMLQAYGLQRALLELGYETKIVDYDEIESKLFPTINCVNIKKLISSIFYLCKIIVNYVPYKKAYKRFEEFYECYMLKTKKFNCYSDIHVDDCDILMVGSDQIWNFKKGYNRPYFQLDFAQDIIKVSYAASMGSFFTLSAPVKENFRNSLRQYNCYSVREEETRDYLLSLLGNIPCSVNIDPVFLLDKKEWMKLAGRAGKYNLSKDYILCYELFPSKEIGECAEKLKKETGMEIIVLAANVYSKQKGDKIIKDAGPLEMLHLISHASYVVTNSFHGTAFAVLMHIPFYSVLTNHGPGRIRELLTGMKLLNRIYEPESINKDKCDFSAADQYISEQKKAAQIYLDSLKEVFLKCVE